MSGQVEVDREESEEALLLPWNAVDAVATRDEYLRKSRFFLEFAGFVNPKLMHHAKGPNPLVVKLEQAEIERGMKEFIRRSISDPKFARNLVVRFVEREKGRIDSKEIGANHLRNCLKPIRLALELNEVPLSWKNVMRLVPRAQRKGTDREYSLEEVQRLIGAASLHLKVAILFMTSSGVRVGAFEYLNVGHVKPLEVEGKLVGGRILVYAGEGDDAYETLISKEAYETFQDYVASRKGRGEGVTETSPAIVTRDGGKRCSVGTIMNSINDLLRKSGVRVGRMKRYEVQANHGLRKYFDNVAKDHMSEEYVEKLIGHSGGAKEHYDRRLPKPLIEQYMKAMPHLSVGSAYRVEAELSMKLDEKQKSQEKEWTELRIENLELKEKQRENEKRIKGMEGSVKDLKLAIAASKGHKALIATFAGAMLKARKVFGEERVDELLFSVMQEQDQRERATKRQSDSDSLRSDGKT